MPDESCRKCGGSLLEYTTCAKCKAAVQFICRVCAHKTIERVHDNLCFRIDMSAFPKSKKIIASVHFKH